MKSHGGKLLLWLILCIAFAAMVATSACAGEMSCKACNIKNLGTGHGCVQYKIVTAYAWWIMGPALVADGKKNDTWYIDKWTVMYDEKSCTTVQDYCASRAKGCNGTPFPPGTPLDGGVM